MILYKDLLIFIAGIILIIKSADFFTDGAEGIAKAFRIPRVVIGVTVVSLTTTFPEFTVSTISAYIGSAGMAIGNALGSCLANIGLILGIAALIRPVRFDPKILKYELPFLLFVTLVLYLFMVDNKLNLLEGVFLGILLIAFFVHIVSRELKERRESKEKKLDHSIKNGSLKFLIGAIGVVLSAKYAIVPSGINIARLLGIPDVVIGLTMVAVGTSLPELFTAIVASVKNMGELAAGNVIGANILNILWVLGFSASIRPLEVDIETRIITMPTVLIITLLMFLFSRTRLRLTRNKALILFIIYIGYIFYIFSFAYS